MVERAYIGLSLIPGALLFSGSLAYPNRFELGLVVQISSLLLSVALALVGAFLTFHAFFAEKNRRTAILFGIGTILSSVPLSAWLLGLI